MDEKYEPTKEEIRDYADWLGMDPDDADLHWIARKGLKTPLPKPWRPCEAANGEIFFYNPETGASQWDHPCDEELRQLYVKERAKKATTESSAASKEASHETPLPAEAEGLERSAGSEGTAIAASIARAAPAESLAPALTLKVPERPSKPPPAKLRPPRPKSPKAALFLEDAFCTSPVPSPIRASPARATSEAEASHVSPKKPSDKEVKEAKSPPTPGLSAILKAEICSQDDIGADQISLWSHLEEGEETLCQGQKVPFHEEECGSLEISSLTAVLEQSNSHDSSSRESRKARGKSALSPWGSSDDHMAELRRLREQLESRELSKSQPEDFSQRSPDKEEPHSHEKPLQQDSTTQTDTTAANTTGDHEKDDKDLEPTAQHDTNHPQDTCKTIRVYQECPVSRDENMPTPEMNAKTKPAGKLSRSQSRPLKDITNADRDVVKLPSTPRSLACSAAEIATIQRLQWELKEQHEERAALDRQLAESLTAASMEQLSHSSTKAALRESQREVQRLQSHVSFKDSEVERLETELQRCHSELASLSAQAKQAQAQLKAQQAEIMQLKQQCGQKRQAPYSPNSSLQPLRGLDEDPDELLRRRRRELRQQHADLEEERKQWRQEARQVRRSRSVSDHTEDLARTRAVLDARAMSLNKKISEYRSLQRALTSGSLQPDTSCQDGRMACVFSSAS